MRTVGIVVALGLLSSTAFADPPEVGAAPTATLVPAMELRGRSEIDTRGRAGAQLRIGLGGVAEFGVGTMELDTAGARTRSSVSMPPVGDAQLLVTATFRIGVAENRLFRGQPGVALGFEKSFVHGDDAGATRVAALTLAASRNLGPVGLHAGAVLWDAELARDGAAPFLLHDRGMRAQLRPFAAAELRVTPRATALASLTWKPVIAGDGIALTAVATAGARYGLTPAVSLDAGVELARGDARIVGGIAWRWRCPRLSHRNLP
jgi:hypothetical protein